MWILTLHIPPRELYFPSQESGVRKYFLIFYFVNLDYRASLPKNMGPVPGACVALDDQERQGCVSRWMKVGVARDSSLGAKHPAIGAGSRWMTRQAGAFLQACHRGACFPSLLLPLNFFHLSPLPSLLSLSTKGKVSPQL